MSEGQGKDVIEVDDDASAPIDQYHDAVRQERTKKLKALIRSDLGDVDTRAG